MPFVKDDPRINREGRPKGSVSVVTAIKKKLEEIPEGDKRTYLDKLVANIMDKAIDDKDVPMIKDIIDRVDGKPKQEIDQNTKVTGKIANINADDASEEEVDKFLLGELS